MKDAVLHHKLTRRYLLWAYKTTRESFERIERKTTQLVVDEYILKTIEKGPGPQAKSKKDYQKFMEEFKQYIVNKRADELKQKFIDGKGKSLHSQYLYLRDRLSAVEAAIKHFLGSRELKRFQQLYEDEFTNRILQAREHS